MKTYSNSNVIKTQAAGNFTVGFPDKNGLIKIDDEIIFYETKTDSNFEGCRRVSVALQVMLGQIHQTN